MAIDVGETYINITWTAPRVPNGVVSSYVVSPVLRLVVFTLSLCVIDLCRSFIFSAHVSSDILHGRRHSWQ